MTSLALLLPLGTPLPCASGNRVKLFSAALDSKAQFRQCGYNFFTPRRSPLAVLALGENLPKKPSIGEQYAQHLVDVKYITLHLVFYASLGRIQRVNMEPYPKSEFGVAGPPYRAPNASLYSNVLQQHFRRRSLVRIGDRARKPEPDHWTLDPQRWRFKALSGCTCVDGCEL